jgi:hypothetical protein
VDGSKTKKLITATPSQQHLMGMLLLPGSAIKHEGNEPFDKTYVI